MIPKNISNNGAEGFVEIYIDNEPFPIIRKSNFMVCHGREFQAQKMLGSNLRIDGSRHPVNFQGYNITHFGVGSGGSSIYGDDVVLLGPYITDKHLYRPISLGNEKYLNEPSLYIASDEEPLIHSHVNALKPFTSPGCSIALDSVSYNEEQYDTRIKCVAVIDKGEPSGLPPGYSVAISEGGIYVTNANNDVKMLAHLCFSTKNIEIESKITFIWNISC